MLHDAIFPNKKSDAFPERQRARKKRLSSPQGLSVIRLEATCFKQAIAAWARGTCPYDAMSDASFVEQYEEASEALGFACLSEAGLRTGSKLLRHHLVSGKREAIQCFASVC